MRTFTAGLVLVGAMLATTPAFADSLTYKKARVTIDVPENWKSQRDGDVITLSDKRDDVAITFVTVNSGAIKEATRAAKDALRQKIRNLTFSEPESITINGMSGFGFSGDGYLGDKNIDLALLVLDTPSDEVDLLVIAIGEDAKIARHMDEVKWVFKHLRPTR
jgi:hypothetical protein